MLNLVLFGPPGSGKGTQASRLEDRYNLVHLSTGDMLRRSIKEGSALGQRAKHYIDAGKLLPDAVMIDLIEHKLDSHTGAAGFIFDGFPRTVPQAEALDDLLDKRKESVSRVLQLEVSEEELTRRILERGKTSGRSDDSDTHVIRARIREYASKTAPVASYYRQQHKLTAVPGEGAVDQIFAALCKKVDKVA